MVKTVRKVFQIGIAVAASVITWSAVAVRANAVTIKLDDSTVKKIEDLKVSDKLDDDNSEYSNAFVYNYDYDIDGKNWSIEYKIEVDPATRRMTCMKPNGERCITHSSVPEPSSILASITAAGLFIVMKRKMRFPRSSQNA